jgi:triacylglycerol lipase
MDWVVYIGILVVVLVLTITIIEVLFSFVYLYIETKLTPESYPKVNIYIFIKNYLFEVTYVLSKYILYPAKFLSLKIHTDPNAKKIIILVHGYMRTKTDWIPLLINLHSKIEQPILTVNLSSSSALSIQQLSAHLKNKIDILAQRFPSLEEITLIGQSMGGLVCAYYKAYLTKNNLIKNIITLGSPFYGTKVAAVGMGQSSRQMQINAKFLRALREKISQHTNTTNYYQIASNLDNLIFPWQSAILATKKQYLILNNVTHLGLISNKQSAEIMLTLLKPS